MKKFIEYIKENGYHTDMSFVLIKTFNLYKNIFLHCFALMMIATIGIFSIYSVLIYSYFPSLEKASEELLHFNPLQLSIEEMTVYFGFNALSNVVLSIINMGIFLFASQYDQFQKISWTKYLKLIFSSIGLQIVLFTFMMQYNISWLSVLLQQNGLEMVSLIVTLVLHTLTLFVLPIAILDKTNILSAVKYSTDIVNIKPLRMLWYMVFAALMSITGVIFFGIGALFTFPLFYIFLYALYHQIRTQIMTN